MLYPIFALPEAADDLSAGARFGTGLYFDAQAGDIRLDGGGRIVEADGREAFIQWCVKAAQTERGCCQAYGANYGARLREVAEGDFEGREEAFEDALSEAILDDPAARASGVGDFAFAWKDDGVEVKLTVYAADGEREKVALRLATDGWEVG